MRLIHKSILMTIAVCTALFSQVASRVEDLVAQMTLEEKAGQMTQINLTVLADERGVVDLEKLDEIVRIRGAGSILNSPGKAVSLDVWHTIITAIQDAAGKTRLKIPVLYGIDSIHGANYTSDATLFPHNIGMAATRNPGLVHQAARATAAETRASGIRWNFDPVLGLGREPMWPRFEETFGEDVLITAVLGAAAISGYEGDGLSNVSSVASCMKHYIGYSVPRTGKDRTPACIPDNEMHTLFVPPFEAAVNAGSSSLMVNSGSINGQPVHSSRYLLTDLLRGQLHFNGMIVSDYMDIIYLYSQHHTAVDNKEAVRQAVMAGVDMSMVPLDFSFTDAVIELVRAGEIPVSRIDEAVSRILSLKFRLGLFDNPYPEEEAAALFGQEGTRALALDAAQQSMTLLKNRPAGSEKADILPLNTNCTVLLAGPAANCKAPLHGSWSYTWQGTDESCYPESVLTIKQALEKKIGSTRVICRADQSFNSPIDVQDSLLACDAEKADVIILCLGENAYAETPGNIEDLSLPRNQVRLAHAAAATGKPVILVLLEGRPRIVNAIEPDMDAVLMAYRPGSRGAEAVCSVLFGDYNPSGRLPFSYPRYCGNTITYDCSNREYEYYNPQWPFGYGLSYNEVTYEDMRVNADVIGPGDSVTVTLTVRNNSSRAVFHTVELYVRDEVATLIPAVKKLCAFKKIQVKPESSVPVTFTVHSSDLCMMYKEGQRIAEPGYFTLTIGELAQRFALIP